MQDLAWVLPALLLGFLTGSLVAAPWLGKKTLKHRELLLINLITSLATAFVFVSLGLGAGDGDVVGASAIASGAVVFSAASKVENKSLPKLFVAGLPYTSFLLLLLGYPGSIAQVCLIYTIYTIIVALGLLIERAGWRR